MKKFFIYFLLVVLFSGCLPNRYNGKVVKMRSNANSSQRYYHPLPPKVPTQIEFAGQVIDLDTDDRMERMDRELASFTYMQSSTLLTLKRAGRIFPQIEPVLKEQGMPDDLKYLAVIESNLNPGARSMAGAVGLWQFMPATATEYGLVVEQFVDERYNIERETVAACKYLNKSFRRFGDWMTVAASYNAGMKGIADKLDQQLADNGMDLWLVEETSRYMFRLLAAKMLFEDPEAFGYRIGNDDVYHYREPKEIVPVNYSISDLATFAKNHGCSYVAFRKANLWIRGDQLPNGAGRHYEICIP